MCKRLNLMASIVVGASFNGALGVSCILAGILAGIFLMPTVAFAQESLGTLGVSGIFLEPSFIYAEPSNGAFEAGRSFVAFSWTREPNLSAVFKVGSKSLIGTPARYGPAPVDQLALIEGYAQLETQVGKIRGGFVPIEFSLEGGDSEERLRFPRSLLFENRIINLRDYGASYHISTDGFFSDFAVHNGEGGTDLDSRMWFTFRAGFQEGRAFKIGLSGSTGSTTALSTNPSSFTTVTPTVQAGYDVTKPAKIRLANFFAEGTSGRLTGLLEATAGDVQQDSGDNRLRAGHADVDYNLSDQWSLLARYDSFDPTSVDNDGVVDLMAGVALKSVYENSVLYLFGSRRRYEGQPEDVHRVLLIWRMTPFANSSRSPI
jgi:hypothetical protein